MRIAPLSRLLLVALGFASIPRAHADELFGTCPDEYRDPDGRCPPLPQGCSDEIPIFSCAKGHWDEGWGCCTARTVPVRGPPRPSVELSPAPQVPIASEPEESPWGGQPPASPPTSASSVGPIAPDEPVVRAETVFYQAALEHLRHSVEIFETTLIDGPGGRNLSRAETDAALKQQLRGKAQAMHDLEREGVKIIESGEWASGLEALYLLGRTYEEMAKALQDSYIPSYLTDDQVVFYKMALEDKIHPQLAKAKEAYVRVLDKAYQAQSYEPVVLMARTRLVSLDPKTYPQTYEELPDLEGTADPSALVVVSEALLFGDFDRAVELLNGDLLARAGDEASFLLAVALRGQGDFDGAEGVYAQLAARARVGQISEDDALLIHLNASTLHERYTKDFEQALAWLEAYKDEYGRLDRQHPVSKCMERVNKAARAEAAARADLEREQQERQDREASQRAAMEGLVERTANLERKLKTHESCPAMIELGMVEMGLTVVEQAQMVIAADEYSMVSDMLMFFDQVEPEIEALIPECE